MTADPALKMDITQVGTMTSIFPIAYGFSKFLSGVLGARTSPRIMLAGGLMATAVINIMFGFGSSMVWFCTWWALNGILQVMSLLHVLPLHIMLSIYDLDNNLYTLQGFGGPCCARILTSWFATKERGTYWGMWNIAHNLGGFSAPILAGSAARSYGWKWGEANTPAEARLTVLLHVQLGVDFDGITTCIMTGHFLRQVVCL